jgi:hypothetical protein
MAVRHPVIVRRCACGRSYTLAEWRRLRGPLIGSWPWGEVHEYRQCLCGSHITIILRKGTPEEPTELPPMLA